MVKQPWMKFYPSDWRADPALRMCEPLSRYVWLEMLGIMHEADPYGHLMVNGIAVTDEALSRLIDVPLKAVRSSLKELGKNGVYSVTNQGIILSRRMVRDEMKARSNRDNGKRGGNPTLKNQQVSQCSVNPSDKGEVKAQIPEARYQSEKREPNGSPKKTGSRISDDWKPSEEDLTFAASNGFSPDTVRLEADKFRDFWISKAGRDGTKLDWSATWRNWLRNSGSRGRAPPQQAVKPRTVLDVIRERREKEQENEFTIDHEPEHGRGSGAVVHFAALSQGRKP